MKATIVYDNNTTREDLTADWGFACYIESAGKNILFDTGADGSILLENMKKLEIDPRKIDRVFISHNHFDHIGGLSAFLNINPRVKVFVPPSLRGIRHAEEVIYLSHPAELEKGIFSSGELDGIEQSMAIKTERGLVLLVGCSHPDMEKIFRAVSPFGKLFAIIGGLHGFSKYELFRDLSLICPTHCTLHKAELKSLYPEKYREGGVGTVIEI